MKFLVPPWDHQLRGIQAAKDREGFGFFFEQGTGKTRTCIDVLRYRYTKNQRILRTLVITPRIVVGNWKKEFDKYSKIDQNKIHPLTGTQMRRVSLFKKEAFTTLGDKKGAIFITNPEAMLMSDLIEQLYQWGVEALVVDESHRFKDYKAKRTKTLVKLSKTVTHCTYLLTGTPMPNSPFDIFTQFLIMDKGKTFGENFFKFRLRYFWDKNFRMPKDRHFPDWQLIPSMESKLNYRIKESSMRVKKQSCLDLPPLVRKRIEVELAPKQKKAYEEMKREFITYVGSDACVAQLAITKGLRLQQILSGFIALEEETGDQNLKRFDKTPRLEALKELLMDLAPAHKVIVWAVFKENYAMIREVCESLKLKYVEVHGGVKDTDKDANVDAFNNDDSVRVFIGHPGSGGIGINLVSSDVSIFYSRNFSFEADVQAEARNHRGGSEVHEKITRIDIVSTGTLDDEILKALERKEKISDKLLMDMARKL